MVLPDRSTLQLVGIEQFAPQDTLVVQMQNILLIELKKGGFKLNRQEVSQADGYVQDIAGSGFVNGSPFITAWVVGQSIAAGVGTSKTVGDESRKYGQVRATTYGASVSTANLRLMRLRKTPEDRYDNLTTDTLLAKILSTQEQGNLDLVTCNSDGATDEAINEAV
ncbi:hypothetical protein [Pseudomonas sp. CFBP13528]|uniref:hypothetical protein n=1 Tax=Pseudomonas sp. CFBP13528 TaxID=2184006 RepID=UPI001F501B6A|nr:hypothetical protein [Pseudomonas sp. CFBP13528]